MTLGLLGRLPKFTCFFVIDLKGKNWGVKQRIFTHQTDFALISTIFIRCGCNFTQSTTMYTKIFRILLTNIKKCFEKILFTRRTESYFLSEIFVDSLRRVKSIFSKHFWMLVNKIRKIFVYIVVLCVKLQPQRIIIVEMRAKSVWSVKIRCLMPQFLPFKSMTKKHVNLGNLLSSPEVIF